MSEPGSTSTENSGSTKKKKDVSPARKAVGFVVLLVVIVVAVMQYRAVLGYNAAVRALEARSQDEDKGLLEVTEAERLLGKAPDEPGTDFNDGTRTFTKTAYTWRGALKSYTLTAFYTKGLAPCLHHFETEGAKYAPEQVVNPPDNPRDSPAVPKKQRAKGKSANPKGGSPPNADAAKTAVHAKSSEPAPAPEPSKPAAKTAPAPEPSKPGDKAAPADTKDPK